MKKVLHVTYDMRIGGTEMVIRNIIASNNHEEFQMSVYCIEGTLGPWGAALLDAGIQVTTFQRKNGFDVKLVKHLRSHVKKNNIDIVHCHQYTPWVYGTLASILTRAKVIFTEHGRFYPDFSTWKRKLVNPLLVSLTSEITAISNATKDALVEYEFIPRNKVGLIYNGIKPLEIDHQRVDSLRKKLGIPPTSKVLGTIARFDPIKNHTMMIEAVAKVIAKHPNTVLIMVGDGEERANIELAIEQFGLANNVILTGYQSNPTDYLGLMDIFLLSSLSEGTSMTLLEAMSLEIPCVVTDAGGNAEIIQNGINGLVSKNDDIIDFSLYMMTIIKKGDVTEYRRNSRHLYNSKFSNKIMSNAYSELYGELTW